MTREQVQSTCEQLVRQFTAMADPTAAGALSIQIHIEGPDSATITTPQIPLQSNLQCGVATAGHRQLRGSLLALGRQPIPWVVELLGSVLTTIERSMRRGRRDALVERAHPSNELMVRALMLLLPDPRPTVT